jgi:cytochrome c553
MKNFVLTFILYIPLIVFAKENSPPPVNKICVSCHGTQGRTSNPQWPNIAGQHPKYFIKQLKDMQNPTLRDVPVMSALVKTLSSQEMDDLAAYYAKMPLAQSNTAKQLLLRGEQIYRSGDFAQKITACIACHGPKGTGNDSAGFPVLSGQHAEYTILQLIAFKNAKRTNDLNHIMQTICSRMSQEDMAAIAQYIENLH